MIGRGRPFFFRENPGRHSRGRPRRENLARLAAKRSAAGASAAPWEPRRSGPFGRLGTRQTFWSPALRIKGTRPGPTLPPAPAEDSCRRRPRIPPAAAGRRRSESSLLYKLLCTRLLSQTLNPICSHGVQNPYVSHNILMIPTLELLKETGAYHCPHIWFPALGPPPPRTRAHGESSAEESCRRRPRLRACSLGPPRDAAGSLQPRVCALHLFARRPRTADPRPAAARRARKRLRLGRFAFIRASAGSVPAGRPAPRAMLALARKPAPDSRLAAGRRRRPPQTRSAGCSPPLPAQGGASDSGA